jgi:hypothetical protein
VILDLAPQLRPGVVFECVGVPGVIAGIFETAMRRPRIDASPLVTGRTGVDGVAAAFEEWKSPAATRRSSSSADASGCTRRRAGSRRTRRAASWVAFASCSLKTL